MSIKPIGESGRVKVDGYARSMRTRLDSTGTGRLMELQTEGSPQDETGHRAFRLGLDRALRCSSSDTDASVPAGVAVRRMHRLVSGMTVIGDV